MNSLNRRNFLKTSAIGAAGLAIAQKTEASYTEPDEPKSMVIKRILGNTGILVPVVSMGCGKLDSPALVKAALKMGINHFDTAHVYQRGNSEILLGETLKEVPRDSFTIGTKVKITSTKEEFLSLLDESLTRLQMDYVDILYLHSAKSAEDVLNPEMLEALKIAKEQGKALHLGLSTHKNEPEVIRTAMETGVYEVVLSTVNFKQDHAEELKTAIAEASSRGIGIIAMKVMAGGFLDKEKTKPVNYKAAMKWVLANENVITTIPTMVNLEQIQYNSEVLTDIELSEQEKSDLAYASAEQGLYCNGCSQCVETCSKGLPIPELMRAYMYTYGYRESKKAKELVNRLGINNNPCEDCNDCHVQCVKGFNLPEKIAQMGILADTPDDFLA